MIPNLTRHELSKYLSSVFGDQVECTGIRPLGEPASANDEKVYGYGKPRCIDYIAGGVRRQAVLHTMKPDRFGHDHRADRAGNLLWSHDAFNRLPRHVRSLNVGAFDGAGHMKPLHGIDEVFLLTEYVEGVEYAQDLQRLREGTPLAPLDLDRADALCDYLIEIHRRKRDEPALYTRRIRDLVGHGECIMGLIDSYPDQHAWITRSHLESIESRAVEWRWRIKHRAHRLAQVHGDFHPWNILFSRGTDFRVLDRSRGEWGDPADDVTSITLNYVFESIQATGKLEGAFETLFQRFWRRYLAGGDKELLEVAPPFIAWRALVMASPVWYPRLAEERRRSLFNLIETVLNADAFSPDLVNDYLQG